MADKQPEDADLGTPLPAGDPGGAHAKGFTAEPEAEVAVPDEGLIPLAEAPDQPQIRQPEKEDGVQPTGRKESGDYTPNDRLMGADR
jgi:hypothetical protein